MKTDADDIIICKNASFGYGGHPVVSGLSFTLRRSGYLCIIGENGSGKSTLLKGILGLMSPMEGTLTLNPEIKKTEIGYLSQETAAKKDFPAGVWEIVLSGNLGRTGLRPFYSRTEKQRAEEALHLLEITDLKERCFRELSGGQQRRALLARSLCAAEKLLVLDEPASGLDPLITTGLYRLLKSIRQEKEMTIVMVSHDIEAAKQYASQIINLGKSLIDTENRRQSND
ncbi:MAG: ATP-binding cassette domain-containing protein [Treponema sp.]|jgi:zinc transport system ATP-binding protein|nr:ATP-binding cassette domain-containing protein [Treponema sp.]